MVQREQEVEPIILREGDNFYTLPSDADGIIDVLDVNNVKVQNNKIDYRTKLFSIKIGEETHHLVLIGKEALNKVLLTALQAGTQCGSLEKEVQDLKSKLMEVGKLLLEERKKATKMMIENQKLKEYGGLFENPVQILKELFKNGKISLYSPGIPPTKFKVLKYKQNKESIDYWMSLFEEWGITDSTQGNYYKLMVTHNEAVSILKSKLKEAKMAKIKNKDIGYVKDYTTCNGGENLSEDDKKDVQAYAEKIFGGK